MSELYTYDATTGNLTNKNGVTLTYGDANHDHAVTAAANPARSYSYDGNGNMVSRPNPFGSGSAATMTYDPGNHLAMVKWTEGSTNKQDAFFYDGDGSRIKSTVGSVTTIYVGNYYEWTGSTGSMVRHYFAGSQRIATRAGTDSGTTSLQWVLSDNLGGVYKLLNQSNQAVNTFRYKPWGETRTGTLANNAYGFTGQRRDSYINLYWMGSRWYDPALGRFTSPDSIVPNPYNPQSWDRFSYVSNNPINFIDPTGHAQVCAQGDEGGGCGRGSTVSDFLNDVKEDYGWNANGDWNLLQSFYLWAAGDKLESFVSGLRNGNGSAWIKNYLGGTNFTKSSFGPFSNGTCMGIDSKNVILAEGFESRWVYEGGTVGLIIHELGHVLDNRIGINIDRLKAGIPPYPAVMIGGGPADALYQLVGGNISESQALKRYAGGVSFANDPTKAFQSPYEYGNNSPADYFAHTLAISVVDPANVPFMASLWMSSFISLLP